MRYYLLTSTALVMSLPGFVVAQDAVDETIELDEIVISADLVPVKKSETGATVELVTSADLDDPSKDLTDELDKLPGVSVSKNGGLGQNATLRLRGLPSRYTGVRFDGIDISDTTAPQIQYDFGGFYGGAFDRVEIVKGSQSALYGSEAIAGVVDISSFTPEKDGISAEANLGYGTYRTASGSFALGFRDERAMAALTYSKIYQGGFSAKATDDEDDGFKSDRVTLKTEYDLTDFMRVGVSGFYEKSHSDYDGFSGPDATSYAIAKAGRVYANLDLFGFDHEIAYSYFNSNRDHNERYVSYYDNNSYNNAYSYNGDREQLSYIASGNIGNHSVSLGYERTIEQLHNPYSYEEYFYSGSKKQSTAENSVFGEVILRPQDQLDLALSLRYDDKDDFDGKFSGRIAAAYQLRDDITLRAVAGTGYRTPSLYERNYNASSDDLDTENSQSFELGVEKTFGLDGFVKLTGFYTKIDDKIEYIYGSAPLDECGGIFYDCYVQRDGETETKGIEISASYTLADRYTLWGNYTYTDSDTDGKREVRVPRHDVNLGLDAEITDQFSAGFDVQYVADIEPYNALAANDVGDHTLVGVTASYDITDNFEAYARVDNALDEDYQTTGGYNTPGRSIYVGLKAQY